MDKFKRTPRRRPLFLMFIPLLVLIAMAVALVGFYERELSQVRVLTDIALVGAEKEVELLITDDKSGLRSIRIELVQGDKRALIFEQDFVGRGFFGRVGPEQAEVVIKLDPVAFKFKDGEAELLVSVRDYSWWDRLKGNLAILTFPVELDTRPPLLYIADSPRYILQGGAGIVTYSLDEEAAEHGVMINDIFHPGFPMPHKGEGMYGAMIGLPHDLERIDKSVAMAVDLAGNSIAKPFGMIMRNRTPRRDRINVSDGFLSRKLPEFLSFYPDLRDKEPLAQYLEINSRIRRENNQVISEVCRKSRPERLWEGRFQRMARSSRQAGFAEHRTYYYGGEEVDRQVHLGIDLASTGKAEVMAANSGEVVFAGYLGIYGEMVIIDHGQGVFSLYSHLSQIGTAVGDQVTKETVIGLSGASGMAGGDHLHFSMLINGVFVDPLEWWDRQWLELNILEYL
ncbi:MAG: M23 family metallopeptidase [Desulfurivibrionaceae bacterium]|nr:M23 family metallopeptidase [Desulfobulbales bacterium]MDT8335486.1 M23 family metallopeptidase [Desulfurivibrionaceae bacterium]